MSLLVVGRNSATGFWSKAKIEDFSAPGTNHASLRTKDVLEVADFPLDRTAADGGRVDAAGLAVHVHELAREAERRVVLDALQRCDWNRTRAAEYLKISRRTLFSKMEALGLERA